MSNNLLEPQAMYSDSITFLDSDVMNAQQISINASLMEVAQWLLDGQHVN